MNQRTKHSMLHIRGKIRFNKRKEKERKGKKKKEKERGDNGDKATN